jgi:hypothetical protein
LPGPGVGSVAPDQLRVDTVADEREGPDRDDGDHAQGRERENRDPREVPEDRAASGDETAGLGELAMILPSAGWSMTFRIAQASPAALSRYAVIGS